MVYRDYRKAAADLRSYWRWGLPHSIFRFWTSLVLAVGHIDCFTVIINFWRMAIVTLYDEDLLDVIPRNLTSRAIQTLPAAQFRCFSVTQPQPH